MTDIGLDSSLPGFGADQLEGFRIGVTSDRRSEDLIAALQRRGAEVLHAPAILLAARGSVLSRLELTASLPEMQDDHAVDVAISRLRQALPAAGIVATVIKRGYRIDV